MKNVCNYLACKANKQTKQVEYDDDETIYLLRTRKGFSKRHLKRLAAKEMKAMYEQLNEAEIDIKQNNSDDSSCEDNVDKLQDNPVVNEKREDDIKKHLKSLKTKIDSFDSKLEVIMRTQAQTLTLLKQILNKKIRVKSLPNNTEFPLKTLEELEKMNETMRNSKSLDPFIESIQHQIGERGLTKNLDRVFDISLILDMNFDGIRDKIALKPYTSVIECIFEAVKKEGDHLDDFIKTLRNAIRLNKNKYFKKRSLEKKKNNIFLNE